MITIASLQDELNALNAKAQAASDDAKKHRTNAVNYSANGYADKAESETEAAKLSDRQSAEYLEEASRTIEEIQALQEKARDIQDEITRLQDELVSVTGLANI